MIYPRLKLARNLLQESGIILISINDGENSNLKRICDETFGEDNFIAQMVWDGGRKNDSRFISESHDYILIYARSIESLKELNIRWKEPKPGVNSVLKQADKIWKLANGDISLATTKLRQWFSSLASSSPELAHQHYKMRLFSRIRG